MTEMDHKAIAEWALRGTTGLSAKCIAQHMMGLKTRGDYPHDGGDFARCESLLDAVPEFRARLGEMAEVNRYWAALVPQWNKIKEAEDRCRMIHSIVRSIEDKDGNVVRLGNGARIRFGRIE